MYTPRTYLTAASTTIPLQKGGSFGILTGADNCTAVTIDPENGHPIFATSGTSYYLVEIEPTLQHAFRTTTLTSEVTTLVGFRNASGPPVVEVT